MTIDYNFQPKGLKSNLGWYDRTYIPHFEGGEIAQFLTYRLADSMPKKVIDRWRGELDPDSDDENTQLRKRIERYLDKGYGECGLRDPHIGGIIEENLLFHHGKRYDLSSWVVMPNHVHVLLTPFKDVELAFITHSIKSYTAQVANRILSRRGRFWQPEVFDRYIRNREHFVNVIRYIERNPVKARLCAEPGDWRYSSAYWKEKSG